MILCFQAKKSTYTSAKEVEKAEDSLTEARAGKGKYSEKDISKV